MRTCLRVAELFGAAWRMEIPEGTIGEVDVEIIAVEIIQIGTKGAQADHRDLTCGQLAAEDPGWYNPGKIRMFKRGGY